jgi:hypothetical protein
MVGCRSECCANSCTDAYPTTTLVSHKCALTVKLRGRVMPQAALRSNESHRTLPRRLDRSRGRTMSPRPRRQLKLYESFHAAAGRAPRVRPRLSVRGAVMSGAPRAESHGPLQRWLDARSATGLDRPLASS